MYSSICCWCCVVNPNGIKTLLANGLSAFFINGSPGFNNRPRSLPINPPDYIILDSWVFGNLIPVDELFAKALRTLVKIWGKLFSSSELQFIFDDNLKTTSVLFFLTFFIY